MTEFEIFIADQNDAMGAIAYGSTSTKKAVFAAADEILALVDGDAEKAMAIIKAATLK